jgi:hypothetical protein
MRKKLAIGVGLVAVVLAVAVIGWACITPAAPPLRVGMNREQAERALGQPYSLVAADLPPGVYCEGNLKGTHHLKSAKLAASVDLQEGEEKRFIFQYSAGPDLLGNNQATAIVFKLDDSINEFQAVRWQVEDRPRTRPPWLDRALKAVGW